MKVLIASGSGRYADPWHPFPRTSPLIAEILESAGFDVVIDDDVDHALASLVSVDLLVVNAGDPWRSPETAVPPSSSIEGFAGALDRGIGILAMHCAVASLRDYPEWAPAIGAVWIPGLSMHPPADLTTVDLDVDGGTDAFELFDERYCRLQRLGRSEIVATHEGAHADDAREPSAWRRISGRSRIAVDVLGHDERSYDSDGHRRLIASLARWTIAE